jgi:hypothetical protein
MSNTERERNDFWGKLIILDHEGLLKWRPDIEIEIDNVDSRRFPEKYIARCNGPTRLDDFISNLSSNDLAYRALNEFVTQERENVRVDGLLRTLDKFPVEIPKPENIILVGAATPNSLMSVLKWASVKNWPNSSVTLIDKSPIPIETVKEMINANYINWPGGFYFNMT